MVVERVVYFVIPSEARNLSLVQAQQKKREIPRFARNDKGMEQFFRCL